MEWNIEDTEASSARLNMMYDQMLIDNAALYERPVLRFFGWEQPAATYGYFINPDEFFNSDALEDLGFDCAKRPTGGGIIFHLSDLTFSILIPAWHSSYSSNTLENYNRINQAVVKAIKLAFPSLETPMLAAQKNQDGDKQSFCMEGPTKYDIIVDGKKLGGAAQRITKDGLLHHGSILISHPPYDTIEAVLLKNKGLMQKMHSQTRPLLEGVPSAEEIATAKQRLKEVLAETLPEAL